MRWKKHNLVKCYFWVTNNFFFGAKLDNFKTKTIIFWNRKSFQSSKIWNLKGLQTTTCQKPAEIPPQVVVRGSVDKYAYKYYRFNLTEADFAPSLTKFTIQLDIFAGRTDLFYSFTDENPKSDKDYIDPSSQTSTWEGHFVERSVANSNKIGDMKSTEIIDPKETIVKSAVIRQSFYQIERTDSSTENVLYFSVQGLDAQNDFELFVHNKTINFSLKVANFSPTLIGFTLLLKFFIDFVL